MQASPDELPVIDSRPQLVEVPLTVLFFKDLEQRGMLEETLVLWTTEFGRMPSSQGGQGRDHNPFVFTNWLCGGGVRGGITCGESDQWGYKPLDRDHPTTAHDVHATVLKLLGIDHTKLTWRNNGIDRRLTDVHGHVIIAGDREYWQAAQRRHRRAGRRRGCRRTCRGRLLRHSCKAPLA